MTEPAENRASLMPILTALAVVGVALIAVFALRMVRGGSALPDEVAVRRAAVGQNDALQRQDYADFRSFTCTAQQGSESGVITAQRDTTSARGARYVDDVKDVSVTGDRATATVVYHFEKAGDDKVASPMTFVRENGGWKVCSPGPR
ncbi:MAG: lumazine-binding protein [Mycobacterium sp.]